MWQPLEVEDERAAGPADPFKPPSSPQPPPKESFARRCCCPKSIKTRLICCSLILILLLALGATLFLHFRRHPDLSQGPCVSECRHCQRGAKLPPSDPLPTPDVTQKGEPWYILNRPSSKKASYDTQNDALKVTYVPGRYGAVSGVEFKSNPFKSLPADSAVLSYSVYFPSDFPWTRGGKLPGFCIASEPGACATGGDWQYSAGSLRMMWREGGRAIGYVYIPLQAGLIGARWSAWGAQGADYKKVSIDTGDTGDDVWCKVDGGLVLKAGEWNDVTMVVAMNTPLLANGWISITVNGDTRTVKGVRWRVSSGVQVQNMLFATFFGGGDETWAADKETYSMFRNFSFKAPADLGASNL